MGLHLLFLQHCQSENLISQYMRLRKYEKWVKGHQKVQKHSQAEVKPKAFVQSGHEIPPMSDAQASSATA
jgi:hypothetical protein